MSNGSKRPHVVIVGGGYVGLFTALRLQHAIRRGAATVTVIGIDSYMTYQPFLPEAAAGNLSPRHVVVPLRQVLRRVRIRNGTVTSVEHGRHVVRYQPQDGPEQTVHYDVLVCAPGSVSKTLPIPGLAECGIGFKTVGEAIALRNHVITQLDLAMSTDDPDARRRALTFVFVGAGFAGVEAMAELADMARDACRYYQPLSWQDMRWVLVEATDQILPEVGSEMGHWTLEQLRERGIDVRLSTRLKSAEPGRIVLDDGTELASSTLVWTAGVKPNPMVAATDLPCDDRGRIKCTPQLTVEGLPDAFSAGDSAAVPDLTSPGAYCAPNAQHAVRQARVLGDNVLAYLRGKPLKPYRHAYAGSVASLGLHKGVANVYGMKLRGWPAWLVHRTYHVSQMPTLNRKVRVIGDWTLALFFPREIVSLGTIQRPRAEFETATRS